MKEKKFTPMESREKVELVHKWLDEKQGGDITVLDVEGICSIAEAIVVVSARSTKHAQALAEFVLDSAAEANIEFLGMEGHKSGDWVLVDLNDIIVHVFKEDIREFYNIEGMWSEAEMLEFCADREKD